jgi:hypothetical protein
LTVVGRTGHILTGSPFEVVNMPKKRQFAKRLGEKLRSARGSRSYQEIADNTGGMIQARMVQNYEEGTEPRYSTLLVLVSALGYTLADLVPEVVSASDEKDTAALLAAVA